jgi:hypothetical protein
MVLFQVLDSDLYLGENFGPVIVLYIGFGLGKYLSFLKLSQLIAFEI